MWTMSPFSSALQLEAPGELTLCIQHLGNVEVLLCHFEGIVQICHRVILERGEELMKRAGGQGLQGAQTPC